MIMASITITLYHDSQEASTEQNARVGSGGEPRVADSSEDYIGHAPGSGSGLGPFYAFPKLFPMVLPQGT